MIFVNCMSRTGGLEIFHVESSKDKSVIQIHLMVETLLCLMGPPVECQLQSLLVKVRQIMQKQTKITPWRRLQIAHQFDKND